MTPDDLLRVAEIVRTACAKEAESHWNDKYVQCGQYDQAQRTGKAIRRLDLPALLAEKGLTNAAPQELTSDALLAERVTSPAGAAPVIGSTVALNILLDGAAMSAMPTIMHASESAAMKCSVCGDPMKPTDPYCIQCGTSVPAAGGLVEELSSRANALEFHSDPQRLADAKLLRQAAVALQQAEARYEKMKKERDGWEADHTHVAGLLQQAERGREDEERYRYLRDKERWGVYDSGCPGDTLVKGAELDAAIDAARKADR